MQLFEDICAAYDYTFPPEAVAQVPATPRDSARLLVCSRNNGTVQHDVYRNLAVHLPKDAVLVFNNTKVIPARLAVVKPTGGTARILFVGLRDGAALVMSDRKLAIGSRVVVQAAEKNDTDAAFTVRAQEEKYYVLVPHFPLHRLHDVLLRYGTTPLPPYITEHGMDETALRERYQTVFAEEAGAVAAPTASLHFTPELFDALRAAGHAIHYVTLHVGLGTFAPLTEEHLRNGALHREQYAISAETAAALNAAKREGKKIIVVGTTVVRTLESAVDARGMIIAGEGETGLFIRNDYQHRFVDGLITNFHVPKSSLMMLVATFVGRERLLKMYRDAIADGYRLFSFGDGMLLF